MRPQGGATYLLLTRRCERVPSARNYELERIFGRDVTSGLGRASDGRRSGGALRQGAGTDGVRRRGADRRREVRRAGQEVAARWTGDLDF